MLVVNTTSAARGADPARIRPRKRVPSSRRRNPGSIERSTIARPPSRCRGMRGGNRTVAAGGVLKPIRFLAAAHVYGFDCGAGCPAGALPAGALFAGAGDGVAGAPAPGAAPGAADGAGWNGRAGAAEAGAGVAGAAGGGVTAWSSTDFGTRARADAICSIRAIARKMPPDHQPILVSRLPAWRVPMNASGEELTPPKLAAMPVPLPL